LLTHPEDDLSLWRFVFCFYIHSGILTKRVVDL